MTDPAISLENVTKRYGGFTAVDDLSFTVRPGEIYGFLGPNGAGKTTTLRMLLGIIEPTGGAINVLGEKSAAPVRARVGYLPEERGLYRKMRAVESIIYFARLRGVPAATAKARAHALMEEFGLGEFIRSKNEALSKGMAQKVQLLSTIAHEPELLILDEPFSGLDPINQQTLEALIRDQRDAGRTIIFSTHVMQHAERLCDRFLILAKGRKRFEGTLGEARSAFSSKVHLRTDAPLELVRALPGAGVVALEGRAADGEATYEIDLAAGADAQSLLKAAIERGCAISRFEQAGATLHDIFVELAGDEASAEASAADFVEAAE